MAPPTGQVDEVSLEEEQGSATILGIRTSYRAFVYIAAQTRSGICYLGSVRYVL